MNVRLKIKLALLAAIIMCVALALSIGAAEIYKDTDGNELFRYDLVSSVITNEQGVGFAKADSENDALIWYITETKTENSDNVYTVTSVKTKDATTISNDTLLLNKEVAPNAKIVSVNYDIGGYTKIGEHMFSSSKWGVCKVMYAYIPSYVTVIGQRLFREAKYLISVEIPYDSQLTDLGIFFVWSCANLRELYIPQYVTKLDDGNTNADGKKNESNSVYFENCKSLKKVIFHPDNVITEIKNAPFKNAGYIEEIRFGNNLKFLGDRSFRGCSKLKNIYFGDSFEGFYSVYMFWGCTSLENLYLPATFGINTTNNTFNFSQMFDSTCSKTFKIHFTGTPEQFLSVYNQMVAAGNNPGITSMVADGVINTDRVIFTTDCNAFYYGEHNKSNNGALVYTDAVTEFYKATTCTRCGDETRIGDTYAPILKFLGYSIKNDGTALCVGYDVDNVSYKAYTQTFGKTLKYGIVAYGAGDNSSAIEIKDGSVSVIEGKKVVCVEMDTEYSSFELKLTGFTASNVNTALVMCAYSFDGKSIKYLFDNSQDIPSTVTYSEINK